MFFDLNRPFVCFLNKPSVVLNFFVCRQSADYKLICCTETER